jgi:hypothetical protein
LVVRRSSFSMLVVASSRWKPGSPCSGDIAMVTACLLYT